MDNEAYICKKEIDWSVLHDGFTLPYDYQVKFYENMDTFMQRGDVRIIKLFMEGKTYEVKLYNVNNPADKRKNDCYQIRYSVGSEFAVVLRTLFHKSDMFFDNMRKLRQKGDRKRILLPDDMKEYLAIYTTEDKDTFLAEPIYAEDIQELKQAVTKQNERNLENEFDVDAKDSTAKILTSNRTVKIRKLNKKIGDNLKLLF